MSDADVYAIQVANHLPEQRRLEFQMVYQSQRKSPGIALVLGLLFGIWGIDRFYVGDVGLGVAKLLTLGGFLIWAFLDLFLIMGAASNRNRALVEKLWYAYGGGQQQAHSG